MEKNKKDSKPESKVASHSKDETIKGSHTSRATDQKMDEKKESSKKEREDEMKSSTSKNK